MINIKTLEEKENPILKRKDLLLMIEHKGEATPKKEDILKMVEEKFKGDPQKIEIIYMFSEKGLAKTKVKLFIWKEKIVEKPKEEKKESTVSENEKTEESE